MSGKSTTKKPQILSKLAHLYDLRQSKARKQYQLQQKCVSDARAKVDQCELDHRAVGAQEQQLSLAAESEALASNIRAQQQIQIKRKWLKYDAQKTEYFLNDALSDLTAETQEADQLRSQWMQLRNRHDEFHHQHRAAIKAGRNNQLMLEEHEQEDEALGRNLGAQHHG